MTTALNTTALNNIHFIINNKGVVTTKSTEIAEIFDKQHKNVMQAIDKIECSEEFTGLNFQPSKYIDSSGKVNKCYNLTKDGFAFLAMGFTGKKAAKFKEIYINEFNRMETTLKNQNKEVELSHVRHDPDAYITPYEIATLFDINEGSVLAMATDLRDFSKETPWDAMGVRINTMPDDEHNLYLNLAAFLMLDLGNSLEVRKQKFRVIGAFEDYANARYISEHQDEFEEEAETKESMLDFKNSANRCNRINEKLIADIEWKNNLTDKSKGNIIDIAIDLLDGLLTETNAKTKQKINNIKNLLANHQQYERHINNEMLERLVFLGVHLTSLELSSIATRLDEILKPNGLTIQ